MGFEASLSSAACVPISLLSEGGGRRAKREEEEMEMVEGEASLRAEGHCWKKR